MTMEHTKNAQMQRKNRRFKWVARSVIACLLLFVLASTWLARTGLADGETTVSIAPESQGVQPGGTFSTDVRVENVANLYGFGLRLSFDPALVEGMEIEPGGFLSPDWQLEKSIDNDTGIIAYSVCQMNPSEPITGTGALATISWRGNAVGTSPIRITYVGLSAPHGVPIHCDTRDGEVIVSESSPTIASLSPVSTTVGNPGFPLTVNGSGFVEGSTVHWDGAARATTFVSDTQLTAAIAAEDVAAAGTAYVTVVNPPPDERISNALPFEIVGLAPGPSSWFVYVPVVFNGYPE